MLKAAFEVVKPKKFPSGTIGDLIIYFGTSEALYASF